MSESKDEPVGSAGQGPTRSATGGAEGSDTQGTHDDHGHHDDTGPIMSPSPQPAFGASGRRDGGPAAGWESEQTTQVGVLDRPVDEVPLRDRLSRPGMARSTRILLLVLGAIVFLAIGLFIGRATAPATGPGSVPPVLGVVESVDITPSGFPVLTVRAADGTLTPLQTTPGTIVAVPEATGVARVRQGQQVTITGERDQRGQIIATRVDLPGR
ncbi:hypothetical protein [Actinomycetospora termitidis]|uniref:DUF5666 domain-containing protein n=1 Tax=Actinomycetospora termitidis TaxID=3053470 RepID=A0ABT7MAL3_9PSEU|nr:hypothetical protein [Actinomycetospora sp. Odt1-22]MDL5157668.1 hypothetical protein [Actinomycetospora sp. Odt1-22]